MKLYKRISLILISTLLLTSDVNLYITTYASGVNLDSTSQQVTFKINSQWDGVFIGEIRACEEKSVNLNYSTAFYDKINS